VRYNEKKVISYPSIREVSPGMFLLHNILRKLTLIHGLHNARVQYNIPRKYRVCDKALILYFNTFYGDEDNDEDDHGNVA
jgi:hypothetical protein